MRTFSLLAVLFSLGCAMSEAPEIKASAEALTAYGAAAECLHEVDPSDAVALDACLVKARHALELIERAEEVCSGEILAEIRIAKAQISEQIPIMEKASAYNRGELDEDETAELIQRLLGLPTEG